MMLLTSCNSPAPEYIHTCPVAHTFSLADKAEAKKELNSIKDHSMLDSILEYDEVLVQESKHCWSNKDG